jgi:predicted PhzF superfamily epimerase YddE/YHI9
MRLRILNAFTGRPFTGNPAAVMLPDDAPGRPDSLSPASLDERCA